MLSLYGNAPHTLTHPTPAAYGVGVYLWSNRNELARAEQSTARHFSNRVTQGKVAILTVNQHVSAAPHCALQQPTACIMEIVRLPDERQKPLLLPNPASSLDQPNGHVDLAPIAASSSSSSPPAHTRPPIPALTGLRAALMLHVLIRNMRIPDAVDTLSWMVGAGAVGVSTFFCLSGFILAYCYGDHRFHTWRCYWAFISRRYARLLPIYYISQLMCVGEQVNAVRQYGWNGWTVLHWLAVATGTQFWWYWPAYEMSPWPEARGLYMLNITLWALSAVLFFYVSMPVLTRAIRWYIGVDRLSDLPRGNSTSRLLQLFVLLSVLIWIPLLATPTEVLPYIESMPYTRIAEFALGLVTAALYLSIRQHQQQRDIENPTSAAQQGGGGQLIDFLTSSPLLNSPIVLDVVMGLTILLVILLGLPSVNKPAFLSAGNWSAAALCYIILMLALTGTPTSDSKNGRLGVCSWLLTRPIVLELGAMSFCFYAFHFVPIIYALSIGLPFNRSAAIEYCAAVGLAWMGYKWVETPVYNFLSARLPSCRCHKE